MASNVDISEADNSISREIRTLLKLSQIEITLKGTMWWAKWSVLILGSIFLSSAVVGNAFYQKKQFYPTVVYITKSKPSMAVVYVQALVLVVLMGKIFQKLFFGPLRAAELEHVQDRFWYAVTETCLAFTVFRDDFSPKFFAFFIILLFLKCFHWLAEERVDFMERSPVITLLFHVRILSLLALLMSMDMLFVHIAYRSTLSKGASVQLAFGFEYAILTIVVVNTLAKYVFHIIDMQSETPWENKAVYLLYTEVVVGLFKVILYILFILIMIRIYTLPLFALRPCYLALRSFRKALSDVIMSRRAINNMNNLYPDVTLEELSATDNVCIICREEMTGGAKKLPCNHIFHTSCLRSWFQRQQTCPTCRLNVLRVPASTAAGFAHQVGNNQPNPMNGAQVNQQEMFRPNIPPFAAWERGVLADMWQQPPANPPPQPGPSANAEAQPGSSRATTSDSNQQGSSQPGSSASSSNQQGTAPNFGSNQFNMAGRFPIWPNSMTNIPPMPYIPLVPPPPPLLQTTGLTNDELRRMEGNMRENIEARLRCLRNVQILLDSAVVQMQQYATMAPNTGRNEEMLRNKDKSSTNSFERNSTQEVAGPSTSSSMKIPLIPKKSSSAPPEPNEEATLSEPILSTSHETSPSNNLPSSSEVSSSSSGLPLSEKDEVRKRRLEMFSKS